MSNGDTSRTLLHQFVQGDELAASEIFDRYIGRLLALVRKRVSPRLNQRVEPEDVVQSALRSFFLRAGNGDYVLQRAGDLWRLLAQIALNKLRRQVEIHTAAKRTIAKEANDNNVIGTLANRSPSPEEEIALLEEVEFVMQQSGAAEREVFALRLAGESVESIANSIGRSQRTVRRLLQACREALEQKLSPK